METPIQEEGEHRSDEPRLIIDLRPFNKRAKELAERLENAMNHGEPRAVFLREVIDFLYSLKDLRP